MASATPPDNLQLTRVRETIPEPENIARHRCLKTKKAKLNAVEEELVTLNKYCYTIVIPFLDFAVSLILQTE